MTRDVSVLSPLSKMALRTIAAMVVLVGVLFLANAPAEAGATNCDWGSGQVCLYKNSSYATGGIIRYTGSDSNYQDCEIL